METERFLELKDINQKKKIFAKQFNVSLKVVQRAFDDVIDMAKANSNLLNTQQLVDASSDPDALLHEIFDWTQDNAYRLVQAELLVLYMSKIISSSGDVYELVEV